MGTAASGMRERWHPWRHLGREYPHIGVSCLELLPGRKRASWTSDGIYLDRRLGQAERRCALTHEIVHLERGPVPPQPQLAAREERRVSIIAAERLIPLPDLTAALMWVSLEDPRELAEELWVDVPTLRIRLRHIASTDLQHINAELARRRPWNIVNA
ncbi:ImmA/IrrE family metallo-endopeptidase [Nocardia sp. NPDC127579]|uniref:ImmA/IrrE family metallo-endopeptidase n=1 Tax=Nocardia sp. NPDC127579 TaxID=3345402 RepID=UPI00363845CE